MSEGKALLEDVLHLEVNTILSDGIQGKGMPPARHALIDLARDYMEKLETLDPQSVQGIPTDLVDPDDGRLKGSRAAFAWVRSAASTLEERPYPEAQLVVLRRIKAHCAMLGETFRAVESRGGEGRLASNDYTRGELNALDGEKDKEGLPRLPDLALMPRERASLRKMWELGTDTVVMQTVVSLDGDVINRIEREYAGEQFQILHRLHAEAVSTSISTWRFLVETVVGVVENLLGMITRPGKRD